MKKTLIIFFFICGLLISNGYAQRIIWQDDFETDRGWTEINDENGKSVVKNGKIEIESENGKRFISRCKTNLDGKKDFTITVEVKLDDELSRGKYVGLVFDYRDNRNFKMFYIEKGFVWFEEYVGGTIERQEKDMLKNYNDDKKNFKFELQRKGQNVIFLVEDEETIEMDGIIKVHSNRIGLMVSGDHEVSFDNAIIVQ